MCPTTSEEEGEERGEEADARHVDEHQQGDLDGTADEASEGAARALEGEFRPPRRGKSQKGDGP